MKKASWKERINYWLDNQIARGTGSMILLLFVVTVLIVILASGLICLIDPSRNFGITVWNNTSTAVNKWMPEAEDAEHILWLPYIISALVAVAGLFVTSILIGILSSGIESKLDTLRGGRRKLLEKGHIILLGAEAAEMCLDEIVSYAGTETTHVVIADSLSTERFDQIQGYQKQLPKNIKLHVRRLDIGNEDELELCSIPDSMAVMISTADDEKTVRSVMACSSILEKNPESSTTVVAGVSSDRRVLPREILDPRILMSQTGLISSKVVIKTCCNQGLADTMKGLVSFTSESFYRDSVPEMIGKSFGEMLNILSGAIPLGIERDSVQYLTPGRDMVFEEGDHLLYYAPSKKAFEIQKGTPCKKITEGKVRPEKSEKIVIIGENDNLMTMIVALPEKIKEVVFIPKERDEANALRAIADRFGEKMRVSDINPYDETELLGDIRDADQVVVLSRNRSAGDAAGTGDDDDTDNIVLLQHIRNLCKKENLSCSAMIVLNNSSWENLDYSEENVEIFNIRAIQSKLVIHAALNKDARPMFYEIMQRGGHELRTRGAEGLECTGKELDVRTLRQIVYEHGAVLLGYVIRQGSRSKTRLNPPLDEKVTLTEEDRLIIIT